MDPNVALAWLRDATDRIPDMGPGPARDTLADEIADTFQALNRWLSTGGFTPAAWTTQPR
jgi:hypothetical protein